jgi:NAD(P)-dependent dehydrogenase (short-subunit alcohol dehydrogenase family)
MLDPAGRVVMVSGASRGIGRAVVERLLADGFHVSAGVRSSTLEPSDRLMVHRYDAESLESAEAWRDATLARFGSLHGLVNAAGVSLPGATLADSDEAALDATWLINVKAPLRLIRLMLPALKQGGDGRVINVSSLSGKRVANANIGYAMSKFALTALTQAVRREAWADGVRATAICPGFVATDMTLKATAVPREQMTKAADLAALIAMALLLPGTANVAELLVNCRLEHII